MAGAAGDKFKKMSIEDTLKTFNVDPNQGLSAGEASKRLAQYGENALEEKKLSSPRYQNKIALAVKRGIKQYFVLHPPRGTELAYQGSEENSQNT